MPQDKQPGQAAPDNGTLHEDGPIPSASDSKVLDDTARMAREGMKELEADPRERKPASE
jgi:hypothetical protein